MKNPSELSKISSMKVRIVYKKKKILLRLCLFLTLGTLAFFFLPWSKSGTYYGGDLCACLCDSNHYLRIEDGMVRVYSPGHKLANYIGPYKDGEGGSLDCYFHRAVSDDGDELAFRIEKAYFGRIIVTGKDGTKYTLYRALPFGESSSVLDDLEVESVTKEGEKLVYRYYDKEHNLIRSTTKDIPKPQPEHDEKYRFSEGGVYATMDKDGWYFITKVLIDDHPSYGVKIYADFFDQVSKNINTKDLCNSSEVNLDHLKLFLENSEFIKIEEVSEDVKYECPVHVNPQKWLENQRK